MTAELCWSCGHPSRRHHHDGCASGGGGCICDLTSAQLAAVSPPITVEKPDEPAIPAAAAAPTPTAAPVGSAAARPASPDAPLPIAAPVAAPGTPRRPRVHKTRGPAATSKAAGADVDQVVTAAIPPAAVTTTLLAAHRCYWCAECGNGPPGPGDCCGAPLVEARVEIHRRDL